MDMNQTFNILKKDRERWAELQAWAKQSHLQQVTFKNTPLGEPNDSILAWATLLGDSPLSRVLSVANLKLSRKEEISKLKLEQHSIISSLGLGKLTRPPISVLEASGFQFFNTSSARSESMKQLLGSSLQDLRNIMENTDKLAEIIRTNAMERSNHSASIDVKAIQEDSLNIIQSAERTLDSDFDFSFDVLTEESEFPDSIGKSVLLPNGEIATSAISKESTLKDRFVKLLYILTAYNTLITSRNHLIADFIRIISLFSDTTEVESAHPEPGQTINNFNITNHVNIDIDAHINVSDLERIAKSLQERNQIIEQITVEIAENIVDSIEEIKIISDCSIDPK